MDFVTAYLHDATGSRSWVDNDLCKPFVANLVASFKQLANAEASSTAPPPPADAAVRARYTEAEAHDKVAAIIQRFFAAELSAANGSDVTGAALTATSSSAHSSSSSSSSSSAGATAASALAR